MKQKIEGTPSFSHIHLLLEPGDTVIAESDAMATMEPQITQTLMTNGGVVGALAKRFFAKESFFVNQFVNKDAAPRTIVLTQKTPGDIKTVKLNGNALYLQPGSYICRTAGVKLSVKWAGFKSWFAGEGLFRILASGKGILWMGGYGHIYGKGIDGAYIIDSNHILAYEPTLKINLQLAGGLFSSFFGGEGFVTRLEGKGKVYMQSRSLNGLASFMNPRI